MEQRGFTVYVPQFPTPENQTLDAWFDVFKEYERYVDEETIMIGHSLGGSFLLRVLEQLETRISTACLVATPIGLKPIKNWEGDMPFIGNPFDWKKILQHARHFAVFHSDNDPYVSLGNGQEAAKQLNIDLNFVSGAGHFNKAAGYLQFPALLSRILQLIKD